MTIKKEFCNDPQVTHSEDIQEKVGEILIKEEIKEEELEDTHSLSEETTENLNCVAKILAGNVTVQTVLENSFQVKDVSAEMTIKKEFCNDPQVSHSEDIQTQEVETQEDASYCSSPVPLKQPQRSKGLSKSDQILDAVAKKLQEPTYGDESGNEAFTNYVSRRLNSMDNRTSLLARKLITDVIFGAEMGNLNASSRVTTDQPLQQTIVTVPCPTPSTSSIHSINSVNCDSEMSEYFSHFQAL